MYNSEGEMNKMTIKITTYKARGEDVEGVTINVTKVIPPTSSMSVQINKIAISEAEKIARALYNNLPGIIWVELKAYIMNI
ncbi:MAG: hypothetical protein A2W22_03180 [Candidatus Levybacteria bacterium RBG_16_35_11]|nr:MAG: hypothetical protein A2W22_03180 [Candidatus Levybacteria bacterium RBG_16_35_11]